MRLGTTLLLVVFAMGCASGGGGADAALQDDADAGTTSFCGNGALEAGEECDGAPIGSCEDMGYVGGALACAADCTIDKSGCLEAACGDGAIGAEEACDGVELGGASCESLGFVTGTLACGAGCVHDVSDCDACGDGDVDQGEECDGVELGGLDCADRGFTGGTLACDGACGLDTSACFDADCGDGAVGGSEDCDGADHGGRTCAHFGFFGGGLLCNSDCTFDVANCHNCGNGRIEGIEQCDGSELGGADCTTRGFTMGTLACTSGCVFDTSACATAMCGNGTLEPGEACDDGNTRASDGCSSCGVDAGWTCAGTPSSCTPICGNAQIHGGEECDGANLGGQTCTTRGFTGGTLRCTACAFDQSACTTTSCANGVIDAGEECDDGNTTRFDGCDATCQVDAGFHLPVRLRNGEGSNHGMLEVLFGGAWRDVCDDTYDTAAQNALANVVCRQLGFTGTGHQFINAFGGGSGAPVMDDVYCTGSEATLAQCPFSGWNVENCGTSEAVGVRCMPGAGDVRLVGGPHGMEGRLQFFHAGAWGEVCDDYFDGYYSSYYGYSTTTVCQQLGYRGGTFLSTYDAPGDAFVLDDVNCTGSERRIGDCPHLAYGSENCSAAEGSGFRCEVHGEGDLRLAAGTARNNGRVEVLHQNVWGTICDDFLTSGARQSSFVAVGCGQLGFSRGGSALLDAAVADGIDPVWMDDLNCAGSESSMASCPFLGWGIENCGHYEDIGLSCAP